MKVEIRGKIGLINGIEIEFSNSISDFKTFLDKVVFITDPESDDLNENVFCYNSDGELLWQVPEIEKFEYNGLEFPGIVKPYESIKPLSENCVLLTNSDGTKVEIQPHSGRIIGKPFLSRLTKEYRRRDR